jgi:hypothetical protein
MWVEKVELTSYGAIQGESIVFSEDKINLVVEPNEYGKPRWQLLSVYTL